MALTARQLNRATLGRQLLLRRERLAVVDAVRRVAALQAQEAASPYIGLWNRLADFDPADLDAAFAERTVVKASLVRITLHAVHAEDYPAFHDAMVSSLRASRLYDGRFTEAGLSIADIDALLPRLLEFLAEPHSKAEIEAMIEGAPRHGQPAGVVGAPDVRAAASRADRRAVVVRAAGVVRRRCAARGRRDRSRTPGPWRTCSGATSRRSGRLRCRTSPSSRCSGGG